MAEHSALTSGEVLGAKHLEYLAWRVGSDTGISSQTIWHALTGLPVSDRYFHPDTPRDPSDFGRCYRLLKRFPEWRTRLSEVVDKHPHWAPMVARWDEMERLYERDLPTGRSDELYDLMQTLQCCSGCCEPLPRSGYHECGGRRTLVIGGRHA